MIMLAGTFCYTCLGDVGLGRNGVLRLSFASLQPRSRF